LLVQMRLLNGRCVFNSPRNARFADVPFEAVAKPSRGS
jgi:hypothetical protein